MFEINKPYGPDRYLLSSLGLPNFIRSYALRGLTANYSF